MGEGGRIYEDPKFTGTELEVGVAVVSVGWSAPARAGWPTGLPRGSRSFQIIPDVWRLSAWAGAYRRGERDVAGAFRSVGLLFERPGVNILF